MVICNLCISSFSTLIFYCKDFFQRYQLSIVCKFYWKTQSKIKYFHRYYHHSPSGLFAKRQLKITYFHFFLPYDTATRFNQGKTYSYDYAGETLSNIEGATEQSTGMKIRARVSIVPLSTCKFAMTVSQFKKNFLYVHTHAQSLNYLKSRAYDIQITQKRLVFIQTFVHYH